MFYAQTEEDNKVLENFNDVITKYNIKLGAGLIVKKPNSIYPRLSNSDKRGKRGAQEVINNLCDGLLKDPPFSIIFDIMKIKGMTRVNGYLCCPQMLCFLNLSCESPKFSSHIFKMKNLIKKNHNNKIGLICKMIELCEFKLEEINEVNKFLMRCGPAFKMPL